MRVKEPRRLEAKRLSGLTMDNEVWCGRCHDTEAHSEAPSRVRP
jgi:hypothetical protein